MLPRNTLTQSDFFGLLKAEIPSHLSLVDELAEALHMSNDSVYRRIRGEKDLSLREMVLIAERFGISLDRSLGLKSHRIGFNCLYVHPENFNFRRYLQEMLSRFKAFTHASQSSMTYLTKDFPIYHYFQFPEIASFKFFFWMKTYLNFPELQKQKFRIGHLFDDLTEIGKEIGNLYYKMPGCEIHNPDNILTTLRQIEYFRESMFFEYPGEIEQVYRSLEAMIDHLEDQTAHGKKFLPGQRPHPSNAEFTLFVTDFYIGDNTQLVMLDNHPICFKVHNGINYMTTSDPEFCRQTQRFMDLVKRNATCISAVSEKARARFFYMIRERLAAYRHKSQSTQNHSLHE